MSSICDVYSLYCRSIESIQALDPKRLRTNRQADSSEREVSRTSIIKRDTRSHDATTSEEESRVWIRLWSWQRHATQSEKDQIQETQTQNDALESP